MGERWEAGCEKECPQMGKEESGVRKQVELLKPEAWLLHHLCSTCCPQ